MILSELYDSLIYHLLHFLGSRETPSTRGNFARFTSLRMNHIIVWTATTRPRHVIVAPNTTLINTVIARMFFGRMRLG